MNRLKIASFTFFLLLACGIQKASPLYIEAIHNKSDFPVTLTYFKNQVAQETFYVPKKSTRHIDFQLPENSTKITDRLDCIEHYIKIRISEKSTFFCAEGARICNGNGKRIILYGTFQQKHSLAGKEQYPIKILYQSYGLTSFLSNSQDSIQKTDEYEQKRFILTVEREDCIS